MKFKLIACTFLFVSVLFSNAQEKIKYIDDEVYYYVEKEYTKRYYNSDQVYLKGMLGRYYPKSCGYDKYGNKIYNGYSYAECSSAESTLYGEYTRYQMRYTNLRTGSPIGEEQGQDVYAGDFMVEGAGSSGTWTYYYKNGNIKAQGKLNNLKKEGKWVQYYSNGNKRSEQYYVITHDTFRESKLEGESKWWYKDSNQLNVVYLNRGDKQVKIESFYNKEGQQLIENGFGTYKIYNDSGLLEFSVPYKNGQRDGVATWYFKNGKVKLKAIYKSGSEEHTGLRWEAIEGYDVNGSPLELGTLKDGNGTWISYDDHGKRQSMSTYENGIRVKYEY